MQHKDVPVTHAKLLRAVWGSEYGSEAGYLRSYVKMLRKKIETDPAESAYILTGLRVGYRLRDPYDPDAIQPSANDEEDF
jgi:two-component system KDP operon response regulator KdpE